MSIYFLAYFIAYISPFEWVTTLYFAIRPWGFYASSMTMFALTIIDYFSFDFHPLQKNIIYDNEKGTKAIHLRESQQEE